MEPDGHVAEALASMAASRGHEVTAYIDFPAATQALSLQAPDCVLVRLNHLTAVEAAEFVRHLREIHPGSYVAAITDAEEPVSRVEAWTRRGFDDFIADPVRFGPGALISRLAVAEQAMLRRLQLEKSNAEAVRVTRRFAEIFDKSPEAALIVTAREGLIVEANAAAEHVLGIPRQDLVQRYLSLMLPDLFDRADYDPKVLTVTDSLRLTEVRHRRPDNTKRWLEVLITRIPWPPTQALLLKFHDITLLKEREARRLHEARMDAANRVLTGAARDLSDALTAVRGNLDLLTRRPASRQEALELLGGATSACERAESLLQRVQHLTRQPHGGQLRRQVMDLRPVLQKAVPFALLNGKSRPVIQLSDDLWPVEVDENVFTEALRRVLQNADEAMPEGGTIFVDAQNVREGRSDDCEQASVRIRLRDQGHGIPKEHLARVFDPFFTTRQGREGMGLAVAAAAIRSHEGHIAIDSETSEGTVVSIWLPVNIRHVLQHGKPLPLPEGDTAPLPAVLARPAPVHARVLFMDDDAAIRAVVQKILSSHGYDVYCTRDGQEAIDAWRKAREFGAPFDLMLVDLDVRGGMGGQECVARLHAEFPALKAVLTTGYIDDELMENYREHGFIAVLPKPFQLERLVQTVGRLLGVN